MYKASFVCVVLVIAISKTNAYTNSASGGYSSFGSGVGSSLSLNQQFGSYGADDGQKSAFGSLSQDYGGQPQVIEVSPDQLPVQVHFRTASSRLNVQQSHNANMPPQVEHASFQDEPHRVVHEVVKPVIQEVREIIQPYRRVTQEIRPVIEEVHTVVHKGEGRRGGAGGVGGVGPGAGKTYGGPSYKSSRA
ncbi:Cuticle protein [Sarcoptes scabiei]|uniref:DFP2-like protein 31 n=1 Tax=Sarcoptes scabiei TaxID=52283 RepID=A0A132AEZ0_SARSC|nr:DFP2-like protein 31 [Sarcoptes scabiei]UXI15785.1 Cuticle protein [Sarcoptes scabiei]